MKGTYCITRWSVIVIFFVCCYLSKGLPCSLADEKKKGETTVRGVTIVSMDAPLRTTIGKKVFIVVVIGNERTTKLTTILTVTCPTTKQQIGREAEALDELSSYKAMYSWSTEGLKEGTYVIRAEVEKVPDETDVGDNVREIEISLER